MNISFVNREKELDTLSKRVEQKQQEQQDEAIKIIGMSRTGDTPFTTINNLTVPVRSTRGPSMAKEPAALHRKMDLMLSSVSENEKVFLKLKRDQALVTEIVKKMDHHFRHERSHSLEVLRAEVADLRIRVNAMVAASVDSNKRSSPPPQYHPTESSSRGIDMDSISSFISSRLEEGLEKALVRFMREVREEQAEWRRDAEARWQQERRLLDNRCAALESEAKKLRNEHASLSKTSVKPHVSSVTEERWRKQEESAHQLSQYSLETRRVVEQVTKTVNDSVAQSFKEVHFSVGKLESDVHSLKSSLRVLQESRKEADIHSGLTEEVIVRLHSQIELLRGTKQGALSETALKDITERLSALEGAGSRGAETSPRDNILGMSSREERDLSERVDTLRTDMGLLNEVAMEQQDEIENIQSWGRATRAKVRELALGAQAISGVRQSVEALAQTLLAQTTEERALIRALEARMSQLEKSR